MPVLCKSSKTILKHPPHRVHNHTLKLWINKFFVMVITIQSFIVPYPIVSYRFCRHNSNVTPPRYHLCRLIDEWKPSFWKYLWKKRTERRSVKTHSIEDEWSINHMELLKKHRKHLAFVSIKIWQSDHTTFHILFLFSMFMITKVYDLFSSHT